LTEEPGGLSFSALPIGGPVDRRLQFVITLDIPGEIPMKRIATFVAMLSLAACAAKKEETPKMDSAAAAPAAAPAPEAAAPTTAAPAMADSMKKDSTAMAAPKADSAKKM
jgi:hypothetical protein